MKNNNPQEATRTVVIGVAQDEKNNMQLVTSPAWEGVKYIPNDCIADTIEHGEQTVFLLQDANVNSVNIRVADNYNYDTNGDAMLQDIADMWIEFGETNAVEEEPEMEFEFNDASQEASSEEEFTFNEPTTQEADYDDSTPNFGDALGVELADHVLAENETADDVALKQVKTKLTAAQRANKARQERYAESKAIKDNMKSDISRAMADGKRHEDFGAWNFRTKTYDMVARTVDPITGQAEYHEVHSEKGDTRVRAIFNPTLATQDNPLGHCLNRAIGPNFVPVEHPDVFIPIIQTVRGINEANGCVYELKEGDKQATLVSGQELITYDAFSFNKGARAMINLDLTDYSTKTRNESAKSLGNFGYVNLSANRISDALVEEEGGHRVGVSIINAHDGKSALQAFMTVLRTYCGNLAARGGVQALLMAGDKTKIRHMEGVVSQFDGERFASQLGQALLESRKNLVAMHILRHIPVEANAFDKILTSFSSHGLIAQPSITISAADIDTFPKDKNGNIVITKAVMDSDAAKIGHGHAWNAMNKGWIDPDQDFVAMGKTELDKQSVGSVFHAAQCLTGVITHNPIFDDGKRTLTGQKHGIETLMKKSDKAANMFEEMAMAAVDAYAKHTGKPVDDLEAMGQWLADNPDQFKIPYSKTKAGKKVMTPITDIPTFQETWKPTIKLVKVDNK
tara:strand:+ start:5078 stop:7126 length:2049 start_codon:yes stop_codon:yes gene_type:complete